MCQNILISCLSINVQIFKALFEVFSKVLLPATQVIPKISISLEAAANIILIVALQLIIGGLNGLEVISINKNFERFF